MKSLLTRLWTYRFLSKRRPIMEGYSLNGVGKDNRKMTMNYVNVNRLHDEGQGWITRRMPITGR